ncbi:MAG: VOC family protein [Granulosicoccus sp.]|nr:VOC family protein [Granulosicoccus sp.]
MHIAQITLVVRDYDEAIDYYTRSLGFTLKEDTALDDTGKRWVVVSPPGDQGASLLLAKAATFSQKESIGNQGGGRVMFFLRTTQFWSDYETMKKKGVDFQEQPRSEPYGNVVVFADLYGNLWDLIGD